MHPADAFLTALGKDRATFQTFPDHEHANGGPRIAHGPHDALKRGLARLNVQGHGIFVMVNHGDLQGRKATNVTGIAAYFADFDGTELPPLWPVPPTMIVESSLGKYHAYWRVTNAPTDERAFRHVQAHLALLFDSDDKIVDLPRVMRLPGYKHQKADPFETRILETNDVAYTHETFTEAIALPKLPVPLPEGCRRYVQQVKQRGRKPGPQRDPLENAVQTIRSAGEGNRNDTLFRIASAVANDVKAGKIDRETAETDLAAAAADAGLPDFEIKRTLTSAMRYAR